MGLWKNEDMRLLIEQVSAKHLSNQEVRFFKGGLRTTARRRRPHFGCSESAGRQGQCMTSVPSRCRSMHKILRWVEDLKGDSSAELQQCPLLQAKRALMKSGKDEAR